MSVLLSEHGAKIVIFLQNKGFLEKNSEKKEREPENGSRMVKKEMDSFTS